MTPDYTDPFAAANTFMSAAKKKDARLLAEATALRAETEAKLESTRQMLKAVKAENAASEDLDALARAFDGMQIVAMNPSSKSTSTRAFSLVKQDDNKLIKRTLYVRKEKDGWKVVDISEPRQEAVGLSGQNRQGGSTGR